MALTRTPVPMIIATAVAAVALAGCGGDGADPTAATPRTSSGGITRNAAGVTHDVAIDWVNVGTTTFSLQGGAGPFVPITPGHEEQALGGASSGVDLHGGISNDCVSSWGEKKAHGVSWSAKNPSVGYPYVEFGGINDTTGYDENETRDYDLAATGMHVRITRLVDWYFNDTWGWVKHFRIGVTAHTECNNHAA